MIIKIKTIWAFVSGIAWLIVIDGHTWACLIAVIATFACLDEIITKAVNNKK